jgi:Zn-dependent peptidase ImmA (M78 family)
MARARYALAKQEADRLLLRAGARRAEDIDPKKIAVEFCDAEVREESFDGDMIGVLIREPGVAPIIGVEKTAIEPRKRFTIAHELGHLVLHNQAYHVDTQIYLRNSLSSRAESAMEIEANQFAANLLMPSWMLRQDVDKLSHVDVDETAKSLADRYRVSLQAMTLRLAKLLKYNL